MTSFALWPRTKVTGAVRLVILALVAGLVLGLGVPGEAGFVSSIATLGAINTFEDQSREAYIDVDGSTTITAGDTLIGFIRVDDKSAPTGLDLANKVYAVFSQAVIGPGPLGGLLLGPSAALPLSAVTGDATIPIAAMAAVYSKAAGFSADLIIASPPDSGLPLGKDLADYIGLIVSEGTFELAAGIVGPLDFVHAVSAGPPFGIGTPLAGFVGLSNTITVANNTGGLTIVKNSTGIGFLPLVPVFNPLTGGITLHDLVMSSGATRGSGGAANAAEWINAAGITGLPQCPGPAPCGFIDDADFSVFPVSEPSSMAAFGLALIGFGLVVRRRFGM